MKTISAVSDAQVAVVIPAYQAAAHIAKVLRGMPPIVDRIIVVDDCSPDQTAAIVQEESRRDPRIRLLRHDENQGVGGAVLTGYAEAHRLGAKIVVKMDSDGQMDPHYLPALVAPIARGEADYTKGNRYLHARQLRSMPPARRIGNLGLSFLTKLASGYWNVFDPTNGYTAIHAAVIPLLNTEGVARRYFFESSMLLELSLLRAVVGDVFIPARYGDETSRLSTLKSLCEFPLALSRGLCRRLWIQYFVRDFSIASVLMVFGTLLLLFGLVFGGWHWLVSIQTLIPTPTGTVMLAVLPVILGIQFLLQTVIADVQNVPRKPLQSNVEFLESGQPAEIVAGSTVDLRIVADEVAFRRRAV